MPKTNRGQKSKTRFFDKHKKLLAIKKIEKPSVLQPRKQKHQELKELSEYALAQKELQNPLIKRKEIDSSMFLSYNTSLVPPYRILVDTNFINFSVQNKLDMIRTAMDCLYAKVTICITDCVIAELEKLGEKFRVALRVSKDSRFERLKCLHRGTYADDCIVNRLESHNVYIVGTCDRDLKRRLRKIPGVPIIYIKGHQYAIERLPDSLAKL